MKLKFLLCCCILANLAKCQNIGDDNDDEQFFTEPSSTRHDQLFEDYHTLFNSSLNLYLACSQRADYYSDLYEQEHDVSDMFMSKLEECETVSRNLTDSVNYTRLAMAKRENIELESDLLNTRKHLDACNENRNFGLSIISDLKTEITYLKSNLTAQINEIYSIVKELNQCRDNLKIQEEKKISNFNLLESCLQREEVLRDQKNRYVIRLTTCRKNREKVLKAPKTQL